MKYRIYPLYFGSIFVYKAVCIRAQEALLTPQLVLPQFDDDIGLLPIHAAPPTERLRLLPPLLRHRDPSSQEHVLSKSYAVRSEEPNTVVVETRPQKTGVNVEAPENFEPFALENGPLFSPQEFPPISPQNTIDQLLESATQQPELLPPETNELNFAPPQLASASEVSSDLRREKLKYIIGELEALEEMQAEEQQQQQKQSMELQNAPFLPPVPSNVAPTRNVVTDSKSKKTTFNIRNATAAEPVPSLAATSIQESLKSTFNGLEEPKRTAPTSSKNAPSETATVTASRKPERLERIAEREWLVNGPIETLLKQRGMWSTKNINTEDVATAAVSGKELAFANVLKQDYTATILTKLDAVLPGSNVPFLSQLDVDSLEEMQRQAKQQFVTTDEATIAKTEARILLSNVRRPRVEFHRPASEVNLQFREIPPVRKTTLSPAYHCVIPNLEEINLPSLHFLRVADKPFLLALFTISGRILTYLAGKSFDKSGDIMAYRRSLELSKEGTSNLQRLLGLRELDVYKPHHLVHIQGIKSGISAYAVKKNISNIVCKEPKHLITIETKAGTVRDVAGDTDGNIQWRWRSKKRPDTASLLNEENAMTQEFSDEHKAAKKKEEAEEKSGATTSSTPQPESFNQTVDKLLDKAVEKGAQEIAEYEAGEEDEGILKRIATIWLQKWWRIGQCIRDYTLSCPTTWDESSDGTCIPPAEYTGPCAPIDFKNVTDITKERFAWSCNVDWPCILEPPSDLKGSACPLGWANPGGTLCIAPDDYDGDCSPATDFNGFTDEEKSQWAAVCHVQWPSQILQKGVKPTTIPEKPVYPSNRTLAQIVRQNLTTLQENGPVSPHTGLIVMDEPLELHSGIPLQLLSV